MRTTKKDFSLFKNYCNSYLEYIGLNEWSVHYEHTEIEGDYARTSWLLSSGVSVITLGKFWDDLRPKNETEIERLALHEILHLLMAPLTAEATERYTNQKQIDTVEHLIIRRLEKLCHK